MGLAYLDRGELERARELIRPFVDDARRRMTTDSQDARVRRDLAYALNAVTTELGAAQVIIGQFGAGMTENSLVVLTFIITATISFSTGTSWGAYALMMPVALPFAFELSGGEVTPLVFQTVAAIAGGGIFGDHASPVSDTTVLSSVGANCDHIDHVITQLPYALLIAALTAALYAVI